MKDTEKLLQDKDFKAKIAGIRNGTYKSDAKIKFTEAQFVKAFKVVLSKKK